MHLDIYFFFGGGEGVGLRCLTLIPCTDTPFSREREREPFFVIGSFTRFSLREEGQKKGRRKIQRIDK